MKKFITLSLLFALAILGTANAAGSKLIKASLKKPIKVNFIIARPKLNCEEGFGFCRLTITNDYRLANTGRTAAATATYIGAKLNIEILKSEIGSDAAAEFKGAIAFPLEEDFVAPMDVSRALGAANEIIFMSGKYPIKETATSYIIVFNCK